jgi:FkbM family methyltransferase
VRGYGHIPLAGHRIRFHDIDRWPYDDWALAARKGEWEPRTLARFAELVRPGDTVVDVGAHFGIYALLASKLAGARGRVVAFEPDPVSRAQLVRNLEGAGTANVEVRAEAVSDTAGRARLGAEALGMGSSSLGDRDDGVEVETVTLAGFCERSAIEPDVLKIDVEGGEAAVLAGASAPLLARVRAAIVEVHDRPLRDRGLDPDGWLAATAEAFDRMELLDEREPGNRTVALING